MAGEVTMEVFQAEMKTLELKVMENVSRQFEALGGASVPEPWKRSVEDAVDAKLAQFVEKDMPPAWFSVLGSPKKLAEFEESVEKMSQLKSKLEDFELQEFVTKADSVSPEKIKDLEKIVSELRSRRTPSEASVS